MTMLAKVRMNTLMPILMEFVKNGRVLRQLLFLGNEIKPWYWLSDVTLPLHYTGLREYTYTTAYGTVGDRGTGKLGVTPVMLRALSCLSYPNYNSNDTTNALSPASRSITTSNITISTNYGSFRIITISPGVRTLTSKMTRLMTIETTKLVLGNLHFIDVRLTPGISASSSSKVLGSEKDICKVSPTSACVECPHHLLLKSHQHQSQQHH